MVPFEPQCAGVLEDTAGLDDGDVPPFGQVFQATGEGRDDLVFALAELVEMDPGIGEFDAPARFELFDFGKDAGHVQQGFGRNATAEEAGPAELGFRFHQRDFVPFVRSQKGSGVATWATAEDDQFCMHDAFPNSAAPQ
jgi:hypothetical protein